MRDEWRRIEAARGHHLNQPLHALLAAWAERSVLAQVTWRPTRLGAKDALVARSDGNFGRL